MLEKEPLIVLDVLEELVKEVDKEVSTQKLEANYVGVLLKVHRDKIAEACVKVGNDNVVSQWELNNSNVLIVSQDFRRVSYKKPNEIFITLCYNGDSYAKNIHLCYEDDSFNISTFEELEEYFLKMVEDFEEF